MALAVFNQFPQLTCFMAQLARAAAHKETARKIARFNFSRDAPRSSTTRHPLRPLRNGRGGLIEPALPF